MRWTNPTSGSLDSRTESYGYDNLNRLTSVNYGDGQTQGYGFDAMGNRSTKSDSSTGGESYGYDAANRLTSRAVGGSTIGLTVFPDANGNTLADTTSSGDSRYNTWDSQNRLTASTVFATDGTSTTSAFTYGSDGLRRRGVVTSYATGEGVIGGGPPGLGGGGAPLLRHGGGHADTSGLSIAIPMQGAATGSTQTDYIYDGTMLVEQVIRHFDGSGSALDTPTTISYLQGPTGPLYRKSSAEADPHWYVYDGLGSVVGELDVNGNLTASKLFDVYGLTRSVSGTPTTRQGFVGGLGHESDDETGLIYMRARYYDPGTGRFISRDPVCKGSNWFIYCGDNPTCYFDSTGKDGEGGVAGCVVAIGAAETVEAGLTVSLDAAIENGLIAAETELEGPVGTIGSGGPTGETAFKLSELCEKAGIKTTDWMYMCRQVAGGGGTIFKAWLGYNDRLLVAFALGDDIFDHPTPSTGNNTSNITWWEQ